MITKNKSKIVEMECMTCGDHEWLNIYKKTICSGCNNGSMQIYTKENIGGMLL